MRRYCTPVIGCAFALTMSLMIGRAAVADDMARAAVKQALESLPTQSFSAHLRLTTNDASVRQLDLHHKIVDGARATYLEVVAPPDLAGIRFLFLHRIDRPPLQYIKVAASRRHVLVSEEARNQPFLDSTYAVADVIEPELDAFTYRLTGEGEVEGRRCQFIEALPREPKKQVYGKTVVAIDLADHLVLRRELYDSEEKLLKVALAERVDRIDGQWTILRQQMKNLADGRVSRLEVTEIRYGVELPDDMFQPAYLLR